MKKSPALYPSSRNELGKTLIRVAVLLGIAILGGLAMMEGLVDVGFGEAPGTAAGNAAGQVQAWTINPGVPNGQFF